MTFKILASSICIICLSTVESLAQCGVASWYGPGFHGRQTASGERFDSNQMTGAHKTLKFGTKVRVTDQKTKKSVIIRINDRGPFIHKRIIDLSRAAAERLGMKDRGLANICYEIIK